MDHDGKTDGELQRTSPNSARIEKEYPVSAETLSGAVLTAASKLPQWSLEGSPPDADKFRAVRTTRLFRFKDDITVTLSETENGSKLVADSASRVGKGDLGQNPRNLEELVSAIEKDLPGMETER